MGRDKNMQIRVLLLLFFIPLFALNIDVKGLIQYVKTHKYDTKNRLLLAKYYIQKGNYKEAKKYIEKYPDSHIVGLRYFNVFGPREQYKGKMASMVWQLAKQMVDGKKPRIFKWGEQKRDQVYVKNIVQINLLALDAKESCIVNAGSGKAVSFNHIIEVLNEVLGFDYEPEYIDNPYEEFYQDFTQADLTNAKKYLNYEPKWNFEDAVKNYVEWLKENRYI